MQHKHSTDKLWFSLCYKGHRHHSQKVFDIILNCIDRFGKDGDQVRPYIYVVLTMVCLVSYEASIHRLDANDLTKYLSVILNLYQVI